jgi:spore coat protein U-like protein
MKSVKPFLGVFMHKILTATLAAGVMAAGIAQAATTTTTFAVTATVQSTCSATAAALAFPNYTPGTGNLTGNTNINVKCTKNTPFTVSLNAGSTTGDAFAQRLMASGANTLQYNLYTTAAFGAIFGDGTGGSATVGGTGTGVATSVAVTVFGQLPDNATNQAAIPGAYSDTITVTVTY